MPMRRSGKRSSVPFRMRSVHASAAAVQRNTDSSGGRTEVVGLRVPRVVERAPLVGDVEHGRDAVVDERAPDRVVVGMRQRPAVDERGRDHREPHAIARRGAPARRVSQPRVAQRHVRDRMHLAARRRSTTDAHQRFHAVMFAVSAPRSASSVRSHSEPEVREHDRLVDAHLGELRRRARRRPSSRAAARRRSSTRPASPARMRSRRSPSSDVWPGILHVDRLQIDGPASAATDSRARRPRCAARRRDRSGSMWSSHVVRVS